MNSTVHISTISLYLSPHQVAEELSGSHVSDLHVLTRQAVQAQAVQAHLQLLHLFTRESR